MAERHTLAFFLRGCKGKFFRVNEKEWERFEDRLLNPRGSSPGGFAGFDTLDGKSVLVNLDYVQGVRFLWDADIGVVLNEAANDENDGGRIEIQFADQPTIKANTETPEHLVDFFTNLEFGPEVVPYPAFLDEDGEWFYVNPSELVWVSASTEALDEGHEIAAKAGGVG